MQTSMEGAVQGTPQVVLMPKSDSSARLLNLITTSLEDSKAEDITIIDIQGKSSIGDYMVIASGGSDRHVGAIADYLINLLKDSGHGRTRVEGLPHCDWVLIDTGDVVVHVFRPEVREFYNLERMWSVDMSSEVQSG